MCRDPIIEEALALRAAMEKAGSEGWRKAIFESDCKVAIGKIELGNVLDPLVLL